MSPPPILIFLIVGLVLGILSGYVTTPPSQQETFMNYRKCTTKKVGMVLESILSQHQSTRISETDDNWDLYLPCGYNHVEKELKNVRTQEGKKQFIFGISGCDKVVSKNGLWSILVTRYGRSQASKIMPETYLYRDSDLLLFQKKYQPGRFYLMKKNIQRKNGILLTNQVSQILNGKKEGYKLIQEYIPQAYILRSRKINLRLYVIVISPPNRPVEVFLHEEGKCIYANKDYSHTDHEFERHITSYRMNQSIYQTHPFSFEELKNYLRQEGKNPEYLFRCLQSSMLKVARAIQPYLGRAKNLQETTGFQLFGVDYIFTDQLHPYLLEWNKGPDMIPKGIADRYMKETVMRDMLTQAGIISDGNVDHLIRLV